MYWLWMGFSYSKDILNLDGGKQKKKKSMIQIIGLEKYLNNTNNPHVKFNSNNTQDGQRHKLFSYKAGRLHNNHFWHY